MSSRDLLPLQHAEILDQTMRDATGDAGDVLGLAASAVNGPSSLSICALIQRSSRAWALFARRAGQLLIGKNAEPAARMTSSPATSLATASPVQRIVPSDVRTNCSSGACDRRDWLRVSISPASAFSQRRARPWPRNRRPMDRQGAAESLRDVRPTRWPLNRHVAVF